MTSLANLVASSLSNNYNKYKVKMQPSLADYTIHRLRPIKNQALLKANDFDCQSDHPAALQVLKEAAQKNDIEAIVSLGKRLFFGDRSPVYFQEGINLIQHAAQQGNGEALCQVACFHALGFLPQDWEKAIQFLVQSAKTGWRPAQGQLIALCPIKSKQKNALSGKKGGDIWQKLANSIDLDCWLASAVTESLSDSPEIKIMPDFISPTMCEWLIEVARPKLERARVYDSVNKKETANETRTNRNAHFTLMMSDVSTLLVQAHIGATIGTSVSHMETIGVLHYAKGEKISPHYDFINPKAADFEQQVGRMGQRRITFIIYLNQNYEGGETSFPKLDVSNKGDVGDAIYFVNIDDGSAPNMDTLHSGNPTTEGEKWIVTQFVREKEVIDIKI